MEFLEKFQTTIDRFPWINLLVHLLKVKFWDKKLGPIDWFKHVIDWFLLNLGFLARMQRTIDWLPNIINWSPLKHEKSVKQGIENNILVPGCNILVHLLFLPQLEFMTRTKACVEALES